jgi:hypothetical protein
MFDGVVAAAALVLVAVGAFIAAIRVGMLVGHRLDAAVEAGRAQGAPEPGADATDRRSAAGPARPRAGEEEVRVE